MTDPLQEAVKRFRDLRSDVERLKSASRSSGLLRMLRLVTDRVGLQDEVGRSTSREPDATDGTSSTDAAAARENDAAAVDDSAVSDTASVATDEAGGWTWDDSRYDFDEWS